MSTRTIKLSEIEVNYLVNSRFLPEDLVQIIRSAELVHDGARLVKLDQRVVDRFLDEFTIRLVEAGFGKDYEPTSEGRLLEDLTGRFVGV